MGFWTGIKNLFTIAPKAVDDILDKDKGLLVKAGGWINDLKYTEEEKARNFGEMVTSFLEYLKATLGESTERSLTRRSIAVLWIKAQLGLILMAAIAIPLNAEWAKQFFDLATCNVMVWGTGSVIVFFFGPYMWGQHIKKGEDLPKKSE